MAGNRKLGLWLDVLRIEFVEVKKTHKRACSGCDGQTTGVRCCVTKGSGRSATGAVLCRTCAGKFVRELQDEATRIGFWLANTAAEGLTDCRPARPFIKGLWDKLRKEAEARKAAKKEPPPASTPGLTGLPPVSAIRRRAK